MYSEARKIHLIEQVLKADNDELLEQLENVFSKSLHPVKGQKPSIYDFVGVISKKDAGQMRKAIEETCETINPDDWK